MANVFVDDLVVDFKKFQWLGRLDLETRLAAGQLAPKPLEVPQKDAQQILKQVVRLVLDLPKKSPPQVVWSSGDNELLVHSDKTRIECSSGVVRITTEVECDQHAPVEIPVPFGVGNQHAPSGLVMSAYSDLQGPEEIVNIWSDAITAFAWELLLEIARSLCAEVGNDAQGRPLVPGSLGATPETLLIQPVARHTLNPGA